MTTWKGRRVWIVGASSGIGRATAQALLSQGAHLVLSARTESALKEFQALHGNEAVATGGSIQVVALDVTDGTGVGAAARAVVAGGPVDLVLYCAGHYRAQRATALDLPDMLQHLDVNYAGALRVLDAVLPPMLARGAGHISLVSSVAGFRGLPRSLAYGPTKAALNNLAESLYLDLHPLGIDVSIINPGFVQTPLTQQNDFPMPALLTPEQAAQHIVRGWARGRFEMHFPRRFTAALRLLGSLPSSLQLAIGRRLARNEDTP